MSAAEHLQPRQFRNLKQLRDAGYVTDGWKRWQQGSCGTYAHALTLTHPSLHFGTLGQTEEDGWLPNHHFAHDDRYAYDSAGRHSLPYKGVHGDQDVQYLHESAEGYGMPGAEGASEHDIAAAQAHARLHQIGPGLIPKVDGAR